MIIEIEKKFLVDPSRFREALEAKEISYLDDRVRAVSQGYFYGEDNFALRVTVCDYYHIDTQAFITTDASICMKFRVGDSNLAREEFEYAIPPVDGKSLFNKSHRKLEKIRHKLIDNFGKVWEIDHFYKLDNLLVAEIELEAASEEFVMPSFLLQEVTEDNKYLNSNLAR